MAKARKQKALKARKKNAPARRIGSFYHGGQPGLKCGDLIRSATDLGFHHYGQTYIPRCDGDGPVEYDPSMVAITAHLGSARGYAARFINPNGVREPGDVYKVEPTGQLFADPDFRNAEGTYFLTDRPARIVSVVQRRVVLTRREQNEACWPYCWYHDDTVVYAKDGTVRASAQMRAQGVEDDYLQLLPKWMDRDEFGSGGAILAPKKWLGDENRPASPAQVLRAFAHLHLDESLHVIVASKTSTGTTLRCGHCGQQFGENGRATGLDYAAACLHQAGPELIVIAKYNTGAVLGPLIEQLALRAPQRWEWVW